MFVQYGAAYNKCNNNFNPNEHASNCLGKCERISLTDLEVDLHNETERWRQMGQSFQGIPRALVNAGLPVGGIGVEILETELKLEAVIEILKINGQLQNLEEILQEKLLQRMTEMRRIIEAERARMIAVPHPRIFLPGNGNQS